MLAPGTVLKGPRGAYRVGEVLAQGNFATGHRGWKLPSGPDVFIKEYSDPTPLVRDEWERFLAHQRVVIDRVRAADYGGLESIVDDFIHGNRAVQVKGFFRGKALDDALHSLRGIGDALQVLAALARCLAVLHRVGLVHNDLKPAQVMLLDGLSPAEGVRLCDFDFALVPASGLVPSKKALTPFFFAPENLGDPAAVGPAADVFTLGLVLYECLRPGGNPFADDAAGFAAALRSGARPAPLPEPLGMLYLAMLARDPADRPTAREVFERAVAIGGLELALPPQATATHFQRAAFCPACGHPVPPGCDVKYCGQCSKPLPTFSVVPCCRVCHEQDPFRGEGLFCRRCGTRDPGVES